MPAKAMAFFEQDQVGQAEPFPGDGLWLDAGIVGLCNKPKFVAKLLATTSVDPEAGKGGCQGTVTPTVTRTPAVPKITSSEQKRLTQ
jgi:hypothetical protein